MSKLVWDTTGERTYETGVKKCVLFPLADTGVYGNGVAWSGITAITESPSGAESNPFYADDIKFLDIRSVEEFGGTIEAYMYPDEFEECNGAAEIAPGVVVGQQKRRPFGLCYRTIIGNDTKGDDYGYKLHFVYGAVVSPSESAYQSVSDSPEPNTMSWEFSTTPVSVNIDGIKPTAHLEISSLTADPTKLKALEEIIYGKDEVEARLPLPGEIATLMKTGSLAAG